MSRRDACFISMVAMACATALAANELPDHWRAWRYSRRVSSTAAASAAGGPAQIVLPWEIFAHCNPGCGDLRLVDVSGQETPYELRVARATAPAESYSARIVENSFVAGQYTQIVGDLGRDTPLYSLVRVETGQPDFIVWAEVALSDDARTWRVVEMRAPIARFTKRSINGTQTIPFKGLNARYLRVRIFQSEQPFPVTGLTVVHQQESRPAERQAVAATFAAAKLEDQTVSTWTAQLRGWRAPVSQLRFSTDAAEFYRAVRISASADGKEWRERGSGCIFRYQQGDTLRESLSIDFPEWETDEILRVEVINGNDQPLSNVVLSLFAFPRMVLFKAQPGANYRLLYGNERAAAPHYDLSRYLEVGPVKPVYLEESVATEEETSNYRDPRPFTERHPTVLWLSLGIAVVLIGLTALKSLRAASPPSAANPS